MSTELNKKREIRNFAIRNDDVLKELTKQKALIVSTAIIQSINIDDKNNLTVLYSSATHLLMDSIDKLIKERIESLVGFTS